MRFKRYTTEDYEDVCGFLIELNRDDRAHINWNWARFEWMIGHPEFDKGAASSIGLWLDRERIVGAAIYDMYFGEAFSAALPGYGALYPEILDYAWRELRDDAGLGIAICDGSAEEIEAAKRLGFTQAEQTETILCRELDKELPVVLPEGYRLAELDPTKEPMAAQWLVWRGFDHGEDRAAFERSETTAAEIPCFRKHFNSALSLAAVAPDGDYAACCCLWFDKRTDYAYVEPVCTVPAERGKGLARAALCEALNRARSLGAKNAYVISDMAFYKKLGFEQACLCTFYWKK